jgi:hypothetical protein
MNPQNFSPYFYGDKFGLGFCIIVWNNDAPPHSLKDSNASLKMKIMEEEGVGLCSLVCNISRGKGAC